MKEAEAIESVTQDQIKANKKPPSDFDDFILFTCPWVPAWKGANLFGKALLLTISPLLVAASALMIVTICFAYLGTKGSLR